ncbi:DNA replication/repair protein RecF [Aestuariimicrobium ganziense]|uniref:DNA replication/repair protein RecF n=1 Tax=Aestuariimicrobium ganziense TaxID=2773677 RepID=UPI001940D19D|nr:DNA replication/repair protein RecF [Aestuariimicrobium ganziense]
MHVEHLQLHDFRSYPSADIALAPGVSVFVGANGQGKTNLVEAVEYLSTLSSHRVAQDAPLVRAGTEQAIVRARVRAGLDDERTLLLECEINPQRANRARINRSPQARMRDLLGVLRTVVFSPEDLAIVKGDPSDRRRFLDQVVVTRWPRMAGVKADYDRLLRQRNTLLKSLSGRHGRAVDPDAESTLDVWDDQLSQVGGELLLARLDTLAELMPLTATAYADIAPQNNTVTAEYRTALDLSGELSREELTTRLLEGMRHRRRDEIVRGVSLVGPHRDEVLLSIGDLPAKGYASHGESWSLALSLKLGAFGLVRADGVEPVLVLDDVFAELDQTRRERLAGAVRDAEQVLVTAAVGADVPDLLAGRRFRVVRGEVTAEDEDQQPDQGVNQ